MTDYPIFKNKVAAYYTLGCKLNFAETSTIGKELVSYGIRTARNGEKADICVINTCSVTELADKKCRQLIRRVHKQHPKAFVIATGCYAQLKPEEVARIEGVDLVLGSAQKANLMQHLNQMAHRRIITSQIKEIRSFVPSCSAGDRTRFFLKVQDGCDYLCSYCTIPFARGCSRNGTIAELTAQAEQAARDGGKEIVITGVNTGDFGKSTGETFPDLLRALDQVEGIARYRISSIEPNLITDEIIDFVLHSKRFAPHFHIPLQSGSDEVLKLMRRRYDTALFRRKIETIKKLLPDAFIGVDVIVGFRGETDEHFETCRTFIESLPVSQLHVFSYSERPGTQALNITPIVDPATKHARSKSLLDVSKRKWREFYETQRGRNAEALFEHTRKGKFMYGFTANYIKTEAPYDEARINRISAVRPDGWNKDHMALTVTFLD
ncbi:MAG: tRNA (N(6)-L-threonylcarbamoyladenosine(37)-C(2))-methylthiotransferase MtaB [Tannerella sp.]|jgi:threonylcarbamoyladenosine tRNA methylthiotransferase MtaB|nr:tRNA (N(6)-L-threonylcarbamoyladenosine(37)-C(2))-methylthiotransferase MtaB [Tannerella sp.]